MVILIQCIDKVGLVAAISTLMAKEQINIISMREHVDTVECRFFVRLVVEGCTNISLLEIQLKQVLPADAEINVNPRPEKKIIVLVTKDHHCLSDILIRNHFKTLGATVQCVIGNHNNLKEICNRFEIPFHFISHENKAKELYENELLSTIAKYEAHYLVLAKFMRILSP